jgi:hypothetical protein
MTDTKPKLESKPDASRRAALKRLGRFAAVTPPAVTLLLATAEKPAKAVTMSAVPLPSSRQLKTPGIGADPEAAMAVVSGLAGADGLHPVDAVGLCLASLKGLGRRIAALESEIGVARG